MVSFVYSLVDVGLQVFKVFYVAWLYQLSDVGCEGGWVRGVGAPHRRLATARADLKASRELAWTMLVFSLFHAIMVRGGKDCLYCSVL